MSTSAKFAEAAFGAIKSIISSPTSIFPHKAESHIPYYECTSAIGGIQPIELRLSLFNYHFLPNSPHPMFISNFQIRRATIMQQLANNQGKIIPRPIPGKVVEEFEKKIKNTYVAINYTSATVAPENLRLDIHVAFPVIAFINGGLDSDRIKADFAEIWLEVMHKYNERSVEGHSLDWSQVVDRFIFYRKAGQDAAGALSANHQSLWMEVADHWRGMFNAHGWGSKFEVARWVKAKGKGHVLYLRTGVWPTEGRNQRMIAEMFPLTQGYVELGKVTKPDSKEMLI